MKKTISICLDPQIHEKAMEAAAKTIPKISLSHFLSLAIMEKLENAKKEEAKKRRAQNG